MVYQIYKLKSINCMTLFFIPSALVAISVIRADNNNNFL